MKKSYLIRATVEKIPARVCQGRRESDDALRLAVAVGNILEENGYDVILYENNGRHSVGGAEGSHRQ